ncbi:MAG: response regulator transcription factor, partial [Nitrospirales bacterium]|nr:response regulator transcription factor [Nitrospirales bacterium]
MEKRFSKKTTVLIADDHPIVRNGVRELIESSPDLKVVGEAEDGVSTIQMVKELSPNIVLLDLSMPYMKIPKTIEIITCEAP